MYSVLNREQFLQKNCVETAKQALKKFLLKNLIIIEWGKVKKLKSSKEVSFSAHPLFKRSPCWNLQRNAHLIEVSRRLYKVPSDLGICF